MSTKSPKLSNEIKVQQQKMLDVFAYYATTCNDKSVLPFLRVLETNLARVIRQVEDHKKGAVDDNSTV